MKNVVLIGRLVKEVDLSYSEKGNAIGSFSIAVNGRKDDKNDETMFFNCKVFGKQAEALTEHTAKGDGIAVVGEIKQHTYNDKKYHTVYVNSFTFLPNGKNKTENN